MKREEAKSIEWNGKQLVTIGDMTEAVGEAREFLVRWGRAFVGESVGYVAGYHSAETAQRIYQLFDVSHPVFGRSQPTPEEALEAGKKMAEDWGKP